MVRGRMVRGRWPRRADLLCSTGLSILSALVLAGVLPVPSAAAQETATIPLHAGSASNGFANQANVSVGGGATISVLVDTGSTGLYVLEDDIGANSTPLTNDGAHITFKYGYSSGNELHGYFVSAPVAFPEASTPLATGAITVGAVTKIKCKDGGSDCPGWPDGQSGVMGVAYSAEPYQVFNPLAQLGGNYGTGFIIVSNDLGDPAVTPHIVVGLTEENTAGFVWASFQPDTGGTQPTGLNAWNTKSINTCFSVNNGSPGCYVTIFDTGAAIGTFETGTSGDALGPVETGSAVNTTVPGVISFTTVAGTEANQNMYAYDPAHGTDAGYNSGAQVFRYYLVAYDAVNGRIGFAPLQNVLLGTIFAQTDADLGIAGGGVLLAGTLVMAPGFSSDRAIAFGTGAGLVASGDAELAGTLSGWADMGVTIAAGAVLKLSGISPYIGTMTVSGGGLVVDGYLPASLLLDGTVLSGTGTVGGIAAASGSGIAPGHSIGTLSVLGNVVLAPGATYTAEIGAAGASDLIAAKGAVYLGGALAVEPDAAAAPVLGASYRVVSAKAGISGTFQSVEAEAFATPDARFPFLSPTVAYGVDAVDLVMERSAVSFAAAARTPNQAAMGRAADTASPSNGAVVALSGLNTTTAGPALQALSGEVYASAQSVMQQQSIHLREAVGARLRQALDTGGSEAGLAFGPETAAAGGLPLTLWLQGYGGWGELAGNDNAGEISTSGGGAVFGLDTQVAPGWWAGLVGGYGSTSFSASAASGSVDAYDIGLYAGTRQGAARLVLGAAYGWRDLSASRTVAFTGYTSRALGDAGTGAVQAFGELSYDVTAGDGRISPFAGLAYVGINGTGVRESGGAAALDVETAAMDTLYSALGARFGAPVALGGHVLWLGATLGWQHAFGDVVPAATVNFASGSGQVALGGAPIATDAALLGVEVGYAPSAGIRLTLKYAGQLADGVSQNSILAQWVARF